MSDTGKARPSGGSNKVGDKPGFIPAPAGKSIRYHQTGHVTNGDIDASGSHDSGKGNRHGHEYGQHPEDKRKGKRGTPTTA